MPYVDPSGSFVHATLYSQLVLQVSQHLFPQQPFFDLSPDKRRLRHSDRTHLIARQMITERDWRGQLV